MAERQPIVVIVGGGFGGLAAAKALRRTPAQVILLDRSNHQLFSSMGIACSSRIQVGRRVTQSMDSRFNAPPHSGVCTGRRLPAKCLPTESRFTWLRRPCQDGTK